MVPRKHDHRHPIATRTYMTWCNMKSRCNNPNRPQWEDWGGRGITYDPRWEQFENFLADMGEAPVGLSLDRRDNDKNYSKKNCRWANRAAQRRNSRKITTIKMDGKTVCLKDYCAANGLDYGRTVMRLWRGWSLEKAVTPGRFHRFRSEAVT